MARSARARRRVVVLVVDLDAGQPERPRARRTPTRRAAAAVVPPPRVRDDRYAAGGGDDRDHLGQRRRVAVDVAPGGPALRNRSNASSRSATTPSATSASATCGRPVAAASPATRRTSSMVDVDAAARAAAASIAGTRASRPVEDPAELVDAAAGTSGRAGRPAGARRAPRSTVLISIPRHHGDPDVDRRLGGLVPALGGVVVGEAEDVEPGAAARPHQLRRDCVPSTGPRVGVEVDAHARSLWRRPA